MQERLSKRMAALGLASRREADEYIAKGWVTVNGTVAQLGQKVDETDVIALDSKAQRTQNRKITVVLNKPVGYVSAQAEKNYRPSTELLTADRFVAHQKLMPKLPIFHLAPAGRLDIDSCGLLILTQDGTLARRIIGEESHVEKEYLVRVKGTLSDTDLQKLRHGLSLDGKPLLPAQVSWQNSDQLRFVLKQGKKRQIRRMCDLVGLRVTGLKRVRIGRLRLGDLPVGHWRILEEGEKI